MADLLGNDIGLNYKGLLNLDTTINTGLDGTLRVVTDGEGDSSPLYLSTTAIGLGTTSVATNGDITLGSNASIIKMLTSSYGSITGSSNSGFLEITETANNKTRITSAIIALAASTGVGIGETSPTARLQVKGSGSTSATTSLLVQNSVGVQLLKVADNGSVWANGGGAISTNTAFGENALKLGGSGNSNIAFGSETLRALTTGSENMGVGRSSLYSLDSGINNVSLGNYSLFACTSGGNNTAVGWDSIEGGATASNITAIGSGTRSGNFSGSVIIGKDATATAANQFVIGSVGTIAGLVEAEINTSANIWNVVINGVARKILLA